MSAHRGKLKSCTVLKQHECFIVLAIIIIVASFLRLYTLGNESLWSDEIYQVSIASPGAALVSIIRGAARQAQSPLDYLLLHLIQTVKSSDFKVRLPAAIYGILSIIAIYALATSLFSRKEGLISAFLLSISLFHIQYSQEVRPYSLTVLSSILAICGFYRAITVDKVKYWVLFLVLTLLAVYTYSFFQLIMLVELLLVIFLFFTKRRLLENQPDLISLKKIGKVIVCLGIVFIFFVPELRLLLKTVSERGYTAYADSLPFMERFTWTIRSFSADAWKQALFAFGKPLSKVYLVLSAIGILISFRKRYVLETALMIFLLIVLPLLVVLMFYSIGRERIEPRYMIFILPIYLIAICRGIVFLSKSLIYLFGRMFIFRGELAVNVSILLFALSIGSFHIIPLTKYYNNMTKQDWRGLVEYVDAYVPVEDKLIFIPDWTINNYHYYREGQVRNFDSPFLRKRWWVTSHEGFPNLRDGEVAKIVRDFAGGVRLWTVNAKKQMSCQKFLQVFPDQIKSVRENLPDNSIIYINNLRGFLLECADFELLLTEAVQEHYHKSTVEVRAVEEFDGLKFNGINLFFDFYEGMLTDYTEQVISMYGKYLKAYYDKVWDFKDNTSESWRIAQYLESLGIEEGVWRLKSSGPDPIIYGPRIDIPTFMIAGFEFRQKTKARVEKGKAQLFWITSNDGKWGSNNKWINIELTQDNKFHTYSVDLLNNRRFRRDEGDKLIQLRFDPAVMEADIEIDYIKLSLLTPSEMVEDILFDAWVRNMKGI